MGVEETGIRVNRFGVTRIEQGRVVWHNASTHGVGRSIKISDCQVMGDQNIQFNQIQFNPIVEIMFVAH